MREWSDILSAYRSLAAERKPCALATVVGVEGSAYRRPGARMLVAEDGRTWGGVSGGCLERDVADRARGVIAAGLSFLHRYDTSDEELIERGVSTGCGGTIEIFIQPLRSALDTAVDHTSGAPIVIEQLRRVLTERRSCGLAVVVKTALGHAARLGESVAVDANARSVRGIAIDPDRRWQRVRSADASVELFVELLPPPLRIVIVGGGPDAVPVATLAKQLGWCVAVVAAKPALSMETRFSHVDERHVTSSDAPLSGVDITANDAVVVMTHNLARDAATLAAITNRPKYLGLLGPRHRTDRVLASLPGVHPARQLHSPVGLDIGSDSPEEIALSIVAEIQSVVHATPPKRTPVAAWQA